MTVQDYAHFMQWGCAEGKRIAGALLGRLKEIVQRGPRAMGGDLAAGSAARHGARQKWPM
ncbi:MAG: hypothetical protein AUK55_08645 [Syntrophobacteraceae bacterium CG2_30_61_12]|nr:MAG: hypothetical protein AUK55_08645 [Syntrophobacteraceae bacterium CG2_30_61_12]